jgi:hypothetical protein
MKELLFSAIHNHIALTTTEYQRNAARQQIIKIHPTIVASSIVASSQLLNEGTSDYALRKSQAVHLI